MCFFQFSTNPEYVVPEFEEKLVRAVHRNKQVRAKLFAFTRVLRVFS